MGDDQGEPGVILHLPSGPVSWKRYVLLLLRWGHRTGRAERSPGQRRCAEFYGTCGVSSTGVSLFLVCAGMELRLTFTSCSLPKNSFKSLIPLFLFVPMSRAGPNLYFFQDHADEHCISISLNYSFIHPDFPGISLLD